MKFEFDYWMLGVIESIAEKEKAKVFKVTKGNSHFACSYDCANKLCDLGKTNLILRAIDRERSKFTLKLEEELIHASKHKEKTFVEIEEKAKKESHEFMTWALQQEEFSEWINKYEEHLKENKKMTEKKIEEDEFKDAPYKCKVCDKKTFQYDEICSYDCEKKQGEKNE